MKFTANYKFRGLKEDKVFEVGEIVDVTVERAKEIESNIRAVKGYEDFELARVEEPKKPAKKAEPKEKE